MRKSTAFIRQGNQQGKVRHSPLLYLLSLFVGVYWMNIRAISFYYGSLHLNAKKPSFSGLFEVKSWESVLLDLLHSRKKDLDSSGRACSCFRAVFFWRDGKRESFFRLSLLSKEISKAKRSGWKVSNKSIYLSFFFTNHVNVTLSNINIW